MGRCPYCGAGSDQPCRSNCDAGYVEPVEPCPTCDGTGDVHRADGEWLGVCDCGAPWGVEL